MTDFDDNFLRNTQLEELTMEPWYKKPLKLVFHDINGTVLYIGDGCPIMIYISKGKIVGDFDRYYLTIKVMNKIISVMEYENIDDRAADYAYAINAIDKFMEIKEEEC